MKKIKFEDLENKNLEVDFTRKTLKELTSFGYQIAKKMNIEYSDLLYLLGLSNGNWSKNQILLAEKYSKLEKDYEKQLFLSENESVNLEIIEKILKHNEELFNNIKSLPQEILKVIFAPENEDLYDRFINLLLSSIDFEGEEITKDTLEKTDQQVLLELFMRIFIKPQQDYKKAFFLSSLIANLKKILPLDFMKKGKKLLESINSIGS